MIYESCFDFEKYIQEHLREIEDLDERKFAKELLYRHLKEVFIWSERQYKNLEDRIKNELYVPWTYFNIFMTIVDRDNYDPINGFWFPLCKEDIDKKKDREYETIYLIANQKKYEEFRNLKVLAKLDTTTENTVYYKIDQTRYQECIKKLHRLFLNNHIPWQTIHMGHIERFFDLIPTKQVQLYSNEISQWEAWESDIREGVIPLWNMQVTSIQAREFRVPCIDDIYYEHTFYLPDGNVEGDGYLIDMIEDILSVRYEDSKVFLRTKKELMEDVSICRLHQGDQGNSYGYHYAVLSNHRKDNIAARYLQQSGNFIQTPMELRRKIEELSGSFSIRAASYEIVSSNKENILDKGILEGNMNHFIGTQVFTQDQRSLLVFYFQKEGQALCDYLNSDYLYESQIRYILSQLQMEFLEYKCVGVLE